MRGEREEMIPRELAARAGKEGGETRRGEPWGRPAHG